MDVRMLNIGCGPTIDDDFENVDFFSFDSRVRIADIRKKIPFDDEIFDLIYNSHFLEHMDKEGGKKFLSECLRVLKPGGVLRVVVPDLEVAATKYLQALKKASSGDESDILDYEYATIDLLDQLVRDRPGGEKLVFWNTHKGCYTESIKAQLSPEMICTEASNEHQLNRIINKVRKAPIQRVLSLGWRHFRIALASICVRGIAGKWGVRAFSEGIFRNSGEPHKWMYDRLSLERALRRAGFTEIKTVDAFNSRCPAFPCETLDQFNGQVRKPDSIFMEAVRPAPSRSNLTKDSGGGFPSTRGCASLRDAQGSGG